MRGLWVGCVGMVPLFRGPWISLDLLFFSLDLLFLRASLIKLLQSLLTVTEMGRCRDGCAGMVPLICDPWISLGFRFEGFRSTGTLDCYRDGTVL